MRVVSGLNQSTPRSVDELDFSGLRRVVVERRRWIIIPTLAALIISTIAVNVIRPRYTAEARIVLENQQNYLPGPERTESSATQQLDAEAVGSQVQILTSRDLARKVIKSVGLQGNPEFDPLADGMGAAERLLVLLGLKRDPTRLSPEDRILESYFDRLTVLSPTKTRVLTVEFSSRDPDLSAKIANTIADLYLQFQSDAKREHARGAAQSLASLLDDLKGRVAAADAKAEAFRSQSGLLVGTNNTSINAQQLADVNTELARARTAQADAQAKANLLREMLRQGRISDVPDVANNELVRRISEQRVTAKAQLALESRTLLPAHPRIRELSGQVADLESEIRAAGEKTARSLDAEARVASSRVENLSKALDVQKKLIGASGTDEVQMRELDRNARALKDELDTTTTRYQEALARENSNAVSSDARIFSRALAPQVPSFPKKLPIIAICTLGALLLSLGGTAAREFLLVPVAPPPRGSRPILSDPLPVAPTPVVTAATVVPPRPAFGRLRAEDMDVDDAVADIETLGVSTGGLLLVTGPSDDDGGLALALARRLENHGRVILLAGDARTETPVSDTVGLADLMNGDASFADVIHRDEHSRLHVIPPGQVANSSGADLASVLDALTGTYDLVILGAPNTTDDHEARTLLARTEIAVVGPGEPEQVAELISSLRAAGIPHVLRVAVRSTGTEIAA